jgi:hypothetical protein
MFDYNQIFYEMEFNFIAGKNDEFFFYSVYRHLTDSSRMKFPKVSLQIVIAGSIQPRIGPKCV